MAARKKAKAQPPKKKGKKGTLKPPVLMVGGKPCTLKDICTYLNELNTYFAKFKADYTALRIAVCNVEKQAFTMNGNANKPPRFCTGGPGNEPAAPPDPPVW